MKGIIDSQKGDYYRCLLENGDIINLHSSEINTEAKVGDSIKVVITLENMANNNA